jgi:hypothetical protein
LVGVFALWAWIWGLVFGASENSLRLNRLTFAAMLQRMISGWQIPWRSLTV